MRGLKWTIVLLLVGPLTLISAKAQTTILERDRSDRQAPAKRLVPPDAPRPVPEPPANVAPFSPFVLHHVEVEGSSLSDRTIALVTSRFIGTSMDRPAIDALANEMSAAYRESDIALYSIIVPNQRGENGVLRVVVVEGRIDEVLVSGDTAQRNLIFAQRILSPVINEIPLRRSTLERALALLGAVPGTKLEPQFLKTNQRGVVKLAVALKTHDFDGGIGVSTRGSKELGRTQLQADASAMALFRAGDRTTLSFGTPLDFERFRYYGLAHQTPLNADGLTVSGNVAYLVTNPSGSSIDGRAAVAGVQMSYPVLLSFTKALSLGAGFDGLNSDNAFLGDNISSDWTRVLRLSESYVESVGKRRLFATTSISNGFDALGARTSAAFATDLAFLKINGQADYDFEVWEQFMLRLGAAAQYSADKLPSAEQASLGGEAFGRAFDSAIVTGDKSVAGSAEFAYVLEGLPTPLSNPEIYTFIDGGQIWRTPRGGIAGDPTGLASAGLGARLTLFSNVALGLEFAHPLDYPDTDPGDQGWRAIFSFSTRTEG